MNKDFSQWHQKKESINSENDRAYFHEREILWCSLGANIGFEQDGKGDNFARPILIFKKFNKEIFWAIPISTKIKTGKFYYPINLSDNRSRCAILSQIRLLDKVGVINEDDYAKIQKAVINLCSS